MPESENYVANFFLFQNPTVRIPIDACMARKRRRPQRKSGTRISSKGMGSSEPSSAALRRDDRRTESGHGADWADDAYSATLASSALLLPIEDCLDEVVHSQSTHKWFEKPALRKRRDMPDWYEPEPYIWGGYRPIVSNWRHCLYSLTFWHNETGNIYTHLAGAILFIGMMGYTWGHVVAMPGVQNVSWDDHLILAALHVGTITCFTASSIFHTFCCHSRHVNHACLRADYAGIVFMIGGLFLTSVYYGFYCNKTVQISYLCMIVAFGTGTAVVNVAKRFMKPKFAGLRLFLFVAFGFLGLLPVVHSGILHGFAFVQRSMAFNHLILMALVAMLGVVAFHFRIPERFAPGKFDYVGHSHQIMHVSIVSAAIIHYFGICSVFQFWHLQNGRCELPVPTINSSIS